MFQEWLLPWWWENYSRHNDLPVAFCDFGLSYKMRRWCEERGQVFEVLDDSFVRPPEEMDPKTVAHIEKIFMNPGWEGRSTWFRKPHACMKSPFDKTVWIDLDCYVNDSILPLFNHADGEQGISMREDFSSRNLSYTMLQAGVIVFRKTPLLQEWTHAAITENAFYRCDQSLISHLLHQKGGIEDKLPNLYNWGRAEGHNLDARIIHFYGESGKKIIRLQMQHPWLKWQLSPLKAHLKSLLRDESGDAAPIEESR